MRQQATIGGWREFAERDPALPQDIDYDAEYRALDLPPGAGLRDVADRARLLSAAFSPDGLPGLLQIAAAERAMQVTLAADRLSRYWRSYGAPPPGVRAARQGAAPGIERAAPRLRLVAETPRRPARADSSARTGTQSPALRAAIAARSAPKPGNAPGRGPQRRHPWVIARSALFKLVLAALLVAAVARVQGYRAEHPSLSAYSDPSVATVAGMPGAPPAHWAGLPAPGLRVFGAAAPAIGGRQRQD